MNNQSVDIKFSEEDEELKLEAVNGGNGVVTNILSNLS